MTLGDASARRVDLLGALALVGGSYLLVFLCFTPGYGTNDDAAMMRLTSGLFRSEASPFMIFTHVSIGYALKTLYGWMPNIPWYAVYLYFVQILAWTLIATALFSLRRGWEAAVFFLAIFLLIGFWIAINAQFTSTSMLLGSAAVFYFLAMSPQSKSWAMPVFTGLLIGIVGLIRVASLKATLAIWGPLLVYAAFKGSAKKLLLMGAVILSVILAAAAITATAHHSDPRWSEFNEFNAIRGQLHNNMSFKEEPASLDAVKWSRSDLRLFVIWFFADREVYTTDQLQNLLSSIELQNHWNKFSSGLLDKLAASSQFISALLISLTLLVWASPRKVPLVLASWVWAFMVGGLAVYMYTRMPPRVLIPMILSATLAAAFLVGIPQVALRSGRPRHSARLAVTAIALLAGAGCAALALEAWAEESRAHRQQVTELKTLYSRLHAFDPQGVFVHWPPAIPSEDLSLLSSHADLPDLNIIEMGWQTRSPTWEDELEALGIDDIYTAIAKREGTYLVKSPQWDFAIRDLSVFIKVHRGISVRLLQKCMDPECETSLWYPKKFFPKEP
jgi:hypothetical protein